MLDEFLRHPFGGPFVVAALMLVLVWTSKAAGRLYDACRLEYRRHAVRRELDNIAVICQQHNERRRVLDAIVRGGRS